MPYIDPDSSSDSNARPERALHAHELRAELHAAMAELSPEEHEAVALCVLGGLSQSEASAATGVNVNTVKARVRRGTEHLREKLKHRPNSLEAFLALPALPYPSGGLDGALSRWVSVAKNGGPTSYFPRLTTGQYAIAGAMAAAFTIVMVILALNPPGTGRAKDEIVAQEPVAPRIEERHDDRSGPGALVIPDESGSSRDGASSDDKDASDNGSNARSNDGDTTTAETPPPPQPVEADKLFTISDKYPSGELRSEGTVLKTAEGSFIHGHWKYYYRDGTLQDEGEYVRNHKQGVWKKYHPNKELASQGPFQDDEMHGLWEYFRADKSPEARGEYIRGKKSGTWTLYFRTGSVSDTTVWQDGARNGWRRRYDASGGLLSETCYVDDHRTGRHIEYDPATRRPCVETTYLGGLKHGIEIISDPVSGDVLETKFYRYGVLQD